MNLDKIITEIWDLLNVTKGEFEKNFGQGESLPPGVQAPLSPTPPSPKGFALKIPYLLLFYVGHEQAAVGKVDYCGVVFASRNVIQVVFGVCK